MKTTTQHQVAHGWQRIEDQDGRAQYLPAPVQQPRQAPVLAEVLPPADALPMARQTIIHDRSTELERSGAFVRFTIPLSVALASVALIAALVGGTPALAAVGLAFAAFAACWLAALVYYVSRSPAGTARHDSNETWKLLRREQQHRHEVEWYILEKHYGDDER